MVREIVPGEGVVDTTNGMRVFESDGLTAYRQLPMVVALTGIWGFGWHMAWQLRRLKTDDAANCLAVFRSNRDAGLIVALFLAVAAFL